MWGSFTGSISHMVRVVTFVALPEKLQLYIFISVHDQMWKTELILKLSFSSKIDTKLPQISKHIPVDFCLQFDVQVLLHVNDYSQNEQGKKAYEQKTGTEIQG